MNEWAAAFDCPIYIHEGDREFIFYRSNAVRLWEGDQQLLWDDLGSSLLQFSALSSKGAILCGDSFYLSKSKRHIAIMYSYPNQILLTKKEFAEVHRKSTGLSFDSLYGAFDWQNLEGNAHDVFAASMQRYLDSYEI
jgi:hypothetical protein